MLSALINEAHAPPAATAELLPAGTVLAYTPADTERGNKCKIEKALSSYDADAAAAVDFLMHGSPHCTGIVGTVGFCLGGHLAFRTALLPTVKAAACWYATDLHKAALGATGDDTVARCAEIKGELLMFWGRQDPHVPLEGRAKVHAALAAAGTNFAWLELNGAHAFMRDENSYGRYDAELALITYELALKLFNRTLGGRLPALPTAAAAADAGAPQASVVTN